VRADSRLAIEAGSRAVEWIIFAGKILAWRQCALATMRFRTPSGKARGLACRRERT